MEEVKSNLYFQVNLDSIEILKQNELNFDDVFIMLNLDEGNLDLLDAYDQHNKDEKILLRYQFLNRRGFLDFNDNNTEVLYKLSEKAKEFLYFFRNTYGDIKEKSTVASKE